MPAPTSNTISTSKTNYAPIISHLRQKVKVAGNRTASNRTASNRTAGNRTASSQTNRTIYSNAYAVK
ncbi:hypothetical protein IJ117_00805 [Candidatus Saccharibacteria bacterium]|nr:hypothetical protein [Candidatus Saccharibacteria bacterium]